ncbi:MAG TPA: DUF4199 domain-containing protein [Chryseolinea sp.]|nr:DUF4199 domain-containing protein [Chryseolinea sp.]HPH46374.1 DUF4199 domain-containing protein [Chryseolinea sp.]HPM32544.1 DUF4199 domain-containing protein [Chryseolinea sp.]
MKKIVLIFGSIAGAIAGGMFLATWPLHENGTLNPENGMLVGYTTMVIALSVIFFAVKSYRDNQLNGTISFGKALVMGLWISLVAAVVYALVWEVMYNTIASGYLEKMADYSLEKMKAAGVSAEELIAKKKEMMESFEWYKNPLLRFGMTMAEILPVGILISLICAALLRKKEFLPSESK